MGTPTLKINYIILYLQNLSTYEFTNVFETHNCVPISIFKINSCQSEQVLVIHDEKVK